MPEEESRQEAVDRMLLAMANYYQQALTQDVVDLYHELWQRFEIDDISAACKTHMEESRWYPKASEIIDIIKRRQAPLSDIKVRALEQWRVVLQQLRRHGAYHPPQFSDPITAHLIKGEFRWSYLSNMKEDEEQWVQKRWCEAFEVAAAVHQDLIALDVPFKVTNLLETVAAQIGADLPGPIDENSESVPVNKITAFKEMLEAKAEKDQRDLDGTNKRIHMLHKQGKALEKGGL